MYVSMYVCMYVCLYVLDGLHNDDDTCDGTELLDQSSTSFGTVVTLTCDDTTLNHQHTTISKPPIVIEENTDKEEKTHLVVCTGNKNDDENIHVHFLHEDC
jgi:hypothetical protein